MFHEDFQIPYNMGASQTHKSCGLTYTRSELYILPFI